MNENYGDNFQKYTKYLRNDLIKKRKHITKPDLYKEYSGVNIIELPLVKELQGIPFSEILKNRKSIRNYKNEPLSIDTLSFLLWSSTGIQREEHSYEFRTAPSAGALYPIETYLCINNVINVENGIYHYNVKHHILEELKTGHFGDKLSVAALSQKMCTTAPVVFIWSAVFDRMKYKYGERAYRYVYLDAGHIAGNLCLSAVYAGLGSCQIAAFFDDEVNALIEIDGVNESVIYMSSAGKPF